MIQLSSINQLDNSLAELGNLTGVTLYNLENIESLVNQNIEKRRAAVEVAEKIIEEEVDLFIVKQNRQLNYEQYITK